MQSLKSKKITVQIPARLLKKAQEATGRGITPTMRNLEFAIESITVEPAGGDAEILVRRHCPNEDVPLDLGAILARVFGAPRETERLVRHVGPFIRVADLPEEP